MVRLISLVQFLVTTSTVLAQPQRRSANAQGETLSGAVPGAFIIEYEDDSDISLFRSQAVDEYEIRREFNHELFKGISIQLSDVEYAEEIALELASLPSVKNIWPMTLVPSPASSGSRSSGSLKRRDNADQMPMFEAPVNETRPQLEPSTHMMTQVDKLHAEGITGKGLKIAFIDDGIDYLHPALGGCFGEGCVVGFGHDFVGDHYDGSSQPIPDDDPYTDCAERGTIVAGVVAAQDNPWGIRGVAPDATIGMYRIFGCQGDLTSMDIMIAALTQAYEDGADIIHVFVNTASNWSNGPWDTVLSRVVARGIPCITAVGDDGFDGMFKIASGAGGVGVTAVASFENYLSPWELGTAYYTISNDTRTAFGFAWAQPNQFDGTPRPIWVTGYDLNNTADACNPLPDDTPDLGDYYVLIRRSTECWYDVQASNVAAKGGRLFVIYDSEDSWTMDDFDVRDISGIEGATLIRRQLGESFVKALEAGSRIEFEIPSWASADNWIEDRPNIYDPGAISIISGAGPTFEMTVKPQFGAPGGGIPCLRHSTHAGGYGVTSGTTLASTFIAGAFALVAQARGSRDWSLIESLLAANANPSLYTEYEVFDFLYPPAQQGAGLVQVWDAAHATTLLEPASLSFNDSDHSPGSLNFTLSNTGTGPVTYKLSNVPTNTFFPLESDGINFSENPEFVDVHAELAFGETELTISPGDSATIEVIPTPPDLDSLRRPLWSGYIAVNGSDGTSLSLLYQGLIGSLHDVRMNVDVWISSSTDGEPIGQNLTFTLPEPGTDADPNQVSVPELHFQMAWGSPAVHADVVALSSCSPNSTASAADYEAIGELVRFPLLWYPRGNRYTQWLGQLNDGSFVSPGRYQIILRQLRIFGDESDPDDWIITRTTPFSIRYA